MKFNLFNRLYVLGLILSLMGAAIVVQIIRVQTDPTIGDVIVESNTSKYEIDSSIVTPERGSIYDSSGHLLAGNRIAYEVGIYLVSVDDANEAQFIASTLAGVMGLDYNYIMERVSIPYVAGESEYAVILDPVDADVVAKLEAEIKRLSDTGNNSLSGVAWTEHLVRNYPEGSLASNILGWFPYRDAVNGRAELGVEGYYNDTLAGSPEKVELPRNPYDIQTYREVPPGASLILTINREVQAAMEELIDQAVESSKSKGGTILVMDPKTGEIIAMANSERMDINKYWEFDQHITEPTAFNRSITRLYEPGSVFKVLTMSIGLDTGTVTPESTYYDSGWFDTGGSPIHNWDGTVWGEQNMTGCMQHSINTCLAYVATEVGTSKYYEYLQKFGIGKLSNIDLGGEAWYPLAVPGDEFWSDSNLGRNAFGQSVSVSVVQLASAISSVANDGKMMAPHVVKAVVDQGVQYDTPLRVVSQPIKAETAHTLSDMLAVSLEEEASNALVDGYRVAGKTGTADIAIPGQGYTGELTNASFVGWGPVDDPKFLIYVWLEEPRTDKWGSVIAAPVFSEAFKTVAQLMNLPPDDIRKQTVSK